MYMPCWPLLPAERNVNHWPADLGPSVLPHTFLSLKDADAQPKFELKSPDSPQFPWFQARNQLATKSVTNLVKRHLIWHLWNGITAGIRWKLTTCGNSLACLAYKWFTPNTSVSQVSTAKVLTALGVPRPMERIGC